MHEAQHGKIQFKDWYQERFHSDPANVLDEFEADIDRLAKDFGIDFDKTRSHIRLSSKEQKISSTTDGLHFSSKKHRGRSALWARIEETDDGIEYPFLTFNTYVDGSYQDTWSGITALWDLYRRECNIQISESEKSKRQRDLEEKAKARQKREAELKRKAEAERKAKEQSVTKDLELHESLQPASSTHKYAKRKRIASVLKHTDIRQGEDKHGKFLSILLHDISMQPRGLQKIYEQKIQTSPNSDPTDKTFTWGMDMNGAHMIIGDLAQALENNEEIAFCEGFATGASWFMATGGVTVVTLNSGNLKKVVEVYQNWYPDAKKTIVADNDCWKCEEGKGNAGLLAALELLKSLPKEIVKAYYPNFTNINMDLDSKPTDWNDVHLNHTNGLKGIKQMLREPRNRLKAHSKPWEFSLQTLSYANKHSAFKAAKRAISAGMALAPLQHTSKQVFEMVMATVPNGIDMAEHRKELIGFTEWLAKEKLMTAKKLRGFSKEKLAQDHINYMKVEGEMVAPGVHLLPKKTLRLLEALSGCVILRAPMASGKTQRTMLPMFRDAERALYIAHRTSLVANACNMLSDPSRNFHVDNYQNLTADMMPFVTHMGTCINSATYPKFQPFMQSVTDLFIDEAKQTLAHVTAGTIDNPVPAFEFLARMMNNVHRTLLCDADANDELIEFCEQACPGQTIHVIEMEADCSDFEVLYTSKDMVYQSAIEALKQGEKVLFASDGADYGADLAADIRAQIPGCRVLNVMANTRADQDVEAFQARPSEESVKYDAVIYSPSIASGVSIESGHFTRHFGVFFGIVSPTDAVQMLRRDRYARRFTIGFGTLSSKKEEDKDLILLGKTMAARLTGHEDFQITNFDTSWASFIANERKSRNDSANNMLLMMIGDRYRVSPTESNPIWEEQAVHSRKLAREICKADNVQRILNNETPSEEEAQRLQRLDVRSQDEAAKLKRYLIETELCAPVDPLTIEFLEEGGLGRVKRLETLLAPMEKAQQYDDRVASKGTVVSRRVNAVAQKKIWDIIFEKTGIDLKTGICDFSASEAQEAMDAIFTSEADIAMYNELKLGAHINPKGGKRDATKWLKSILERLGQKTRVTKKGREKLRRQTLCGDQFAFMMTFVKRREQANVSCLNITVEDEAKLATTNTAAPAKAPAHAACTDTGTVSFGGGAGCFDDNIYNTDEPAPPAETGDGEDLVSLSGVSYKGLERALIEEGQPVPGENMPMSVRLILLALDFKELITSKPAVLERHPELSWVDWKLCTPDMPAFTG